MRLPSLSTRCAPSATIDYQPDAWGRCIALLLFVGAAVSLGLAGVPAAISVTALAALTLVLLLDLARHSGRGTTRIVYRHNSRRLKVTVQRSDRTLYVDRCQWLGRSAVALHARDLKGPKQLIFLAVPAVDAGALRRLKLWQRSLPAR